MDNQRNVQKVSCPRERCRGKIPVEMVTGVYPGVTTLKPIGTCSVCGEFPDERHINFSVEREPTFAIVA